MRSGLKKASIPWDQVRQRLTLMKLGQKFGVTKACERMGKHRSYYYYWARKYSQKGWRGLIDLSRRPKSMPRLTSVEKVQAVVRMRKKTNYGKERLHDCLKEKGIVIPVSILGKILHREGLLFRKRTYTTQKKHTRCYNLLYPGQRVQMDIKYVPSEVSPIGRAYYQYTVIDECSRMRYLAWHDSIWTVKVVEALKEAQAFFGFQIDCVQTDNGIEFTFDYTAQLTAQHKEAKVHPLDAYCEAMKIKHKLIPAGQKEINGKVERSHRTDDEEFYRSFKRRVNLFELRDKGQKWLKFYNFRRRHSSIGRMTPAQFAVQRLQMYPERVQIGSKQTSVLNVLI
jgi:transposase InsO family protein